MVSVEPQQYVSKRVSKSALFSDSLQETKPSSPNWELDSFTTQSCSLSANGGVIMNGPAINVYTIFFGHSEADYSHDAANTNSTAAVVNRFVSNVGHSQYANILTHYQITDNIVFKGTGFLSNKNVTSLTDSLVSSLIGQAIIKYNWPYDSNGIYSFIFRGDISYKSDALYGEGWGSYWCGFHASTTINGKNLLYAVVGDPAFANPTVQIGCFAGIYLGYANKTVFHWSGAEPYPAPQSMKNPSLPNRIGKYFGSYFVSPNNNMFADAVVYTLSHEITEVATNPRQNGWFSTSGSCSK